MLTPNRPPPEDYYQNNCRELFDFTLARYADLLPPDVARDVSAFLDASDDAQRLFARLLTRKGPNVRVDSLNYREIDDRAAALDELLASQLIIVRPDTAADEVLRLLKKDELAALWPRFSRKLRKSELLDGILGTYGDRQIRARVAEHHTWVAIARRDTWRLMRLLYFGHENQDWATFVLRDLGMTRYEAVSFDVRQFADRSALSSYLNYRALNQYAHRVDEHPELIDCLLEVLTAPADTRFAERRRCKALLHIGRACERQAALETALDAYATVPRHPARERSVRVLAKLDRADECESLLNEIRREPLSEEEAQFADRFGKRNAGYQPPTTVVDIDAPPVDVEAEALEMLIEEGGWGMHVESALVRTLTGLIYWDAMYAPIPGAFTNPFQTGPNDLTADDFVDVRAELIEAIEAETHDDDAFVARLLATAEAKHGITNALVHWRVVDEAPLEEVVTAMPVAHMRRLTQFFIRNLKERRSGLPDLFVAYGENDYELVEVKGPNDQLQPGQRVWFRHLGDLDIPARVLKLRLVG
jgi:hypothetical protein